MLIRELFVEDELFRRSLTNILYYAAFHIPGTIMLAFLAAILLNQKIRAMPLWQTMHYLPSVTTGVATSVIWIWLLQPNGLINQAFGLVGIAGPNWLLSTTWAMPALILLSFWNIGGPGIPGASSSAARSYWSRPRRPASRPLSWRGPLPIISLSK